MIVLDALSSGDCEKVRVWRNQVLGTLRTPHALTYEQQQAFYRDVVCDARSPHRYWAARRTGERCDLVGMVGLVDVQWENRLAEISLIIDPGLARRGFGRAAVDAVLREAFERMALLTVWGECYGSNPAVEFWRAVVAVHNGYATYLPRRKFWAGRLWDSYYFSFSAPEGPPRGP